MSDTRSTESFTFAMGEFEATFPRDRQYAKNHMWARCIEPGSGSQDSTWRFGLSAYAVRLLQDVYFLDWEVEAPTAVEHRQMIGAIESKKAESDLYAPIAGTLSAINEHVLSDPSLINADPYGAGWMIELDFAEDGSGVLLSPDQYADHLTEAWQVAQRTIKGQANF
ncbi:glycine cleavage system protein H [Stieleria sp. ICT_E10.1]|uniref:glycine cleavage system protein H n=1 Tax=Stieleria sedimenti TaxID=2976331 RepID=UPI00217F42ED|nr:glycine cleavage system protein H [Stieleria sedimenti]MCS7467245.1 glycine cleavage system protein H [Stieleria sedimenti]